MPDIDRTHQTQFVERDNLNIQSGKVNLEENQNAHLKVKDIVKQMIEDDSKYDLHFKKSMLFGVANAEKRRQLTEKRQIEL